MKKLIAIALAALLAAVSLWGCNTANNADKLPDGFDAATLQADPYKDFSEVTIWNADENEFYIYIKEWNEYRKINVPITLDGYAIAFDKTCTVVDEENATLALYNFDRQDAEVIVYTFKRNDQSTEYHSAQFHPGPHFHECPTVFLNTLDVNNVCLLYTTEDARTCDVTFMRVETTDGGKTWSEPIQIGVGTDLKQSTTNVREFFSHDIGAIGFRYYYEDDLCSRTYLTFNGGKTWEIMSQLPYPEKVYKDIYEDFYSYSEIVNLEKTDEGYLLTVAVNNGSTGSRDIIYFTSDDLREWKFSS